MSGDKTPPGRDGRLAGAPSGPAQRDRHTRRPDRRNRAALATGRIAFSTSLGLEDQAVLHAHWRRAAADVDVFTLDTGRHFPETLETLAESERRYGLRIRVVAPDAGELEDVVGAGRRAGLSHLRRGAQGLLRGAQGAPAATRPLPGQPPGSPGSGAASRAGRAEVPFAAWDDAYGLIKVNPIADWSRRATRGLHRRQRRAGQRAACAGLSLDRLPALHASRPARRGHPRGTLVVGER